MHRPALAAWLLLAAARGAAAFASSTAWCGASRGPLPRARPGCPRGPSPASPRCWRRPAPAAGARAGFEGGGEEPEEWEALEAQDQKLRKNRRDVARGLREDVARLEADNSTAILQRMSVPREKDAQRRGTSTMFLAAELTTDDGLQLSGNLLLEARSNWVRDLLSTGNSLLLRRIADRLGFVGLWAISVSLYFALSPAEWHDFVHVPAWPHELVGGFLSILLVFRTDQAYQVPRKRIFSYTRTHARTHARTRKHMHTSRSLALSLTPSPSPLTRNPLTLLPSSPPPLASASGRAVPCGQT